MSKLVPLADAYRMVLRSECAERPDFANEINALHFRWPASMGASAHEMKTATEVREKLRTAIMQQRVRLQGCTEDGSATDINVIEIQQNGMYFFEGEIHRRDGKKYENVHCEEDDIRALLNQKGKGGRKPIVDWRVVFVELERLMDYHDEFGADVPEWNAQARLVEALQNFCSGKFGIEPGKNTIEGRIKEPLAQWREQKRQRSKT